jgi:hypothetical protein
MLVLSALCLSLTSVATIPDTIPQSVASSGEPMSSVAAPADPSSNSPHSSSVPSFDMPLRDRKLARPSSDSGQGRPKVIELSDWYYRRLTIHRWVAYGTLPVFAAQWAAGQRLYDDSREAPTWAKTTHRVGATVLAAGFTVNTVTGLWNLWDSRSVEQGRVLRTVHGLSILVADGLFTYAGAKLSDEAEQSAAKRREHRTIALSAMALTTASGLAMKLWNR